MLSDSAVIGPVYKQTPVIAGIITFLARLRPYPMQGHQLL